MDMVNVGFGNTVVAARVVAVVAADSAPVKRLIEAAAKENRLVDATKGRKTRSVLVTDSHHVVASHLTCQKLAHKIAGGAVLEVEDSAG